MPRLKQLKAYKGRTAQQRTRAFVRKNSGSFAGSADKPKGKKYWKGI